MLRNTCVLLIALAGILSACATDQAQPEVTAQGDDLRSSILQDPEIAAGLASGEFILHRAGEPNVVAPLTTHSYTQTCRPLNEWIDDTTIGATVRAWSTGGCRRFDGSFTSSSAWAGTCFGDVSNCNGQIVCQSHCP